MTEEGKKVYEEGYCVRLLFDHSLDWLWEFRGGDGKDLVSERVDSIFYPGEPV